MKEFIPSKFYLSQNYPNPFEDETKIKYCLPVKSKVCLEVYNADGDVIKVLVNRTQKPGTYEVIYKNLHCKNGEYYYSIKVKNSTMESTPNYYKTKKMFISK